MRGLFFFSSTPAAPPFFFFFKCSTIPDLLYFHAVSVSSSVRFSLFYLLTAVLRGQVGSMVIIMNPGIIFIIYLKNTTNQ